MQFTPKKSIKRFQQGGPVIQEEPVVEEAPVEGGMEEAPAEGGEQNPLVMLAQGAMQALQNQDCQMAMQVCQGLLQVLQSMQGPAPQEAQGKPVFRKGGVLIRRVKK